MREKAHKPLECCCSSSPVSVTFGAFAAGSSNCPTPKGCLFYLAFVWPVAALAFDMKPTQALCLACYQGASVVPVDAGALCGFVGECVRGGRRFEVVVRSARSLSWITTSFVSRSWICSMGFRPGVFSRRLRVAKVFKLVLNTAEEPRHHRSEQVGHGLSASLLLAVRKPIVCQ